MIKIIHLASGNTVAEFSYLADAENALAAFESDPPSHEIQGTEELTEEVAE